jgi:hypothetical protein
VEEKTKSSSRLSKSRPKELKGGRVLHSVGLMKKIARMPASDRKQILHILKKQKITRKGKVMCNTSKNVSGSNSNSSKGSHSSINNDWENWVVLQGKEVVAKADVRDLGQTVGVKYQCVTNNSFNLLTKEGRKEWRAARVGGEGRDVEGCLESEESGR